LKVRTKLALTAVVAATLPVFGAPVASADEYIPFHSKEACEAAAAQYKAAGYYTAYCYLDQGTTYTLYARQSFN
jgi:hypothetical protein